MIPTTIPSTVPTTDLPVIYDDTPLIPTISPIVPTIPPIAPTIQYTSPFICTDSSESDTPDTLPSQDPYERITLHLIISPQTTHHEILRQILIQTLHLILLRDIFHQLHPYTGALSSVRAKLLSPRKRIRDSDSVIDLEVSSEESYVPYIPRDIRLISMLVLHLLMILQLERRMLELRIGLRPRMRPSLVREARLRLGLIRVTYYVVSDDTIEPVREDFPELVSANISLKVMQRGLDMGHRIVATSQQSVAMCERIGMLERYNRRLRGMLDVERHRVDRLRRSMSYVQRDLRQICRFQFYDRVRLRRLETYARRVTQDVINELIAKRVKEALKAYDAAKNPRTKMEIENEQQDDNVEANVNGDGNGNGNGNANVKNGGVVPITKECNYQEFMKCQPLSFKGTKGIWNSHKRTVGVDTAYAITRKVLIKLVTEVYCPRNEIQKMEMELWNLTVKSNDLTDYNQRFQELTLLCTKMVPEEEDKVEKYIGCLPDNIQGNVIAAEPTRLQDAIRIANNLMDQKLKGYTIKNAENKRRFKNNSRDNHGQQQPFKRQNVSGPNVARAYTVRNNVERRGYVGALPYCSNCRLHHEGPYKMKCGNCKRVGHMTRDCKSAVDATPQRAPVGNQTGNICYECGRP
ncbi:reverse transcriptase domain-containing protein [Tanacetum coccineum]|uniref:Reverse transcriptase domain-containing protein n=1 Tax=Tanacetum coccineum TaxID=301880 RepID=A0ABQ4Y691_9ASTR